MIAVTGLTNFALADNKEFATLPLTCYALGAGIPTIPASFGKLTGNLIGEIVDAEVKRSALLKVRDELGLRKEQIIGLGDGANDLKFMAEAGVSIAYHAKPVVRVQATHALTYVGLDGALNLFN